MTDHTEDVIDPATNDNEIAQATNVNEIDPDNELETDDLMEKVTLYAFDQAIQKLEQGGIVEPFTILIEGENLKIESHSGEDAAECFESARRTIYVMEKLTDAYVFCYDGYVEMEDETKDALIVERAFKGDVNGEALALMYTEDEDNLTFEDDIYSLGESPSLFNSEEITSDQLEEV